MVHLGDITKIDWAEVEPVDCVTGGSPCQDLSVAGKRAGLAGERSGLYMEQIRCVKELREQDVRNGRTGKLIRPRYMVWENVPGAFSSNGGKDFAAVLEEAVKIAEPEAADVPVPEKGWPSAGCLYDEMGRWSIAWRVHDAQFWGVPQRRKRISLICDFGGKSAPEILFERKGLSGDFEQSGAQREGAAESVEGSAGGTVGIDLYNQNITGEAAASLTAACGGTNTTGPKALSLNNQAVCYGISSYDSNSMKSPNPYSGIYEADTSRTLDLNGGSPACNQGGIAMMQDIKCYDMDNERGRGPDEFENVSPALTARAGTGGNNVPCVQTFQEVAGLDCRNGKENGDLCGTIAFAKNQRNEVRGLGTKAGALQAEPGMKQQTFVVQTDDARGNGDRKTVCTLTGDHQNRVTDYTAICIGNGQTNQSYGEVTGALNCMHDQQAVKVGATVRRLTPTECERLQGYPDGWTDIGEWVDSKGKKHREADSPRYKALGNSIALPFWKWLLKRISAQYEREATLGSLFDGIGGFPLCWEQINGKGSARWASEIEEFPMAVTRKRFGNDQL